jgi:hypothetical protein
MSFLVPPVDPAGGCCPCERAVDACTCCPLETGFGFFSFFDSSGQSGPPCGPGPPENVGKTVGPETIYSSENFKTKCLQKFKVKALVDFTADNYGYVQGDDTSVICPLDDNDCNVCVRQGTIDAYIERVNATESRAYVVAFAANAPHGGGYGMGVSVFFYLDAI